MTNSLLLKNIQDSAAQLRLPTVAREGASTFLKTGHAEALEAFLEVLQMEVD